MMSHIVSAVLEDHSMDINRSGEGAAIELKDGSLYFIYGDFDGGGDASPARLVSRRSSDGGETWSDTELFFAPEPDWVNAMSVSLLRLADGRIGAVFMVKLNRDTCVPYWITSSDETASWSEPQQMIANGGYYVVNNDRLVQLYSGRLLLPYAYSPTLEECIHPRCGCFISDDAGESWRHGDEEIYVQPENYHIPKLLMPDKLVALRNMTYERVSSQEPGVVELTDGRVMMWARSNGGCAYVAYSEDNGQTWSPFKVLCDTPMATGPATIMRVPNSKRLVMLHNDRTGVPYGDDTFEWRTPLAVSVSDDDGASWQPHEPLICDDSHNYCYYSMAFFADKCLVTTYESVNNIDDNGKEVRRNLRSLRTLIVDNIWWMG